MFDMDELMKRAQAASDAASQQLQESMEKSRKIAEQAQKDAEKAAEDAAKRQSDEGQAAQQDAANQQRQVEILGQMFSPGGHGSDGGQPGADPAGGGTKRWPRRPPSARRA